MNYKYLKEKSTPHFYAIAIDRFFPRVLRGLLRKIFVIGAILFFIVSFISLDALPLDFSYADGAFFLSVFIYLLLAFLEFFYNSMRANGLSSVISENNLLSEEPLDYTLSLILYYSDEIDTSKVLFESKFGKQILKRTGLSFEDMNKFIFMDRDHIISSNLNFETENLDLFGYLSHLYDRDKSLSNFLSGFSISKEDFLSSALLESKIFMRKLRQDRFWGRENLGSIPSIGTSWAYGISYELGQFGIPLERSFNVSLIDVENGYREKEISLLEGILERREEANAIIIDDDESVARDIVGRLLKKIKLGTSLPSVEHKNIIELDWVSLTASFKEKVMLESEILKILNQAVQAGNIILYIRDFPSFVTDVKASGINLPTLMSPYLESNNLHIVAHSTNTDFHFFIETNGNLLERFERILPDEIGEKASIPPIIEKALELERVYKIDFSYGSLHAIAESADRYITMGEMPEKALDLLTEVTPWAKSKGLSVLHTADVNAFVSDKTGIETGEIKTVEAEKIAHLEEILHTRVVGQNIAIDAIASAIRRARSGLTNPSRPLGSFLFLGPTGVGKTETSKALAESFFGDENKMVRLDMSEYNGPDATSRLIGSFAENKAGLLASKLRDNPYGVLLLDEFEKSASDVLDLFLQILDEGFFTDALGKKVNCRNLIIIATSNAGSSDIWQVVKSGGSLKENKDKIIDSIINSRVFKPELINRFDGTILFEPLQNNELKQIAKLELVKLQKRIKEKEIDLVVTDFLVDFLVEKGSDPQFGARSINRAVKNIIEDVIAKKIINGEVRAGGKVELNLEDLSGY